MIAGSDRHLEVRQVWRPLADGQDNSLVGRQIVSALRNEQAGLAHALGFELLDDDLVEEGA
jgi:hypothetical protein